MDRKDFQELSKVRLGEANALLDAGHCDGAYYLAGYAVECALKACIAKATRRGEFPDKARANLSHTHDLKGLMEVAGLTAKCVQMTKTDLAFFKAWDLVRSWSEQSRYRKHSTESAQALLSAIGDRKQGVLSWIMQQW